MGIYYPLNPQVMGASEVGGNTEEVSNRTGLKLQSTTTLYSFTGTHLE